MYISCCNITGDIKVKKLKQLYGVHVLSMLLVLITYTGVQHDLNITWCLCRLEVSRQVPPVEEELEHLRSPSFFLLLFFLFFGGGVMLLNLYCYVLLCIDYVFWCPPRFQYHMMFVSFRSSTAGVTSGAGTVYRSGASTFTYVFLLFWRGWAVHVAQSLLVLSIL